MRTMTEYGIAMFLASSECGWPHKEGWENSYEDFLNQYGLALIPASEKESPVILPLLCSGDQRNWASRPVVPTDPKNSPYPFPSFIVLLEDANGKERKYFAPSRENRQAQAAGSGSEVHQAG